MQFHSFRTIKLLKLNPGTQIRVSPSLSRDTEQAHSIFDLPAKIRVIKFFEILIFGGNSKSSKLGNFEIV